MSTEHTVRGGRPGVIAPADIERAEIQRQRRAERRERNGRDQSTDVASVVLRAIDLAVEGDDAGNQLLANLRRHQQADAVNVLAMACVALVSAANRANRGSGDSWLAQITIQLTEKGKRP